MFCSKENCCVQWLQDHPRFLSNPLYIAGDSYSGLIIPTLTLEIDRSKLPSVHQGFLFYLGAHLIYNEWMDNTLKAHYGHYYSMIEYRIHSRRKRWCLSIKTTMFDLIRHTTTYHPFDLDLPFDFRLTIYHSKFCANIILSSDGDGKEE